MKSMKERIIKIVSVVPKILDVQGYVGHSVCSKEMGSLVMPTN